MTTAINSKSGLGQRPKNNVADFRDLNLEKDGMFPNSPHPHLEFFYLSLVCISIGSFILYLESSYHVSIKENFTVATLGKCEALRKGEGELQ